MKIVQSVIAAMLKRLLQPELRRLEDRDREGYAKQPCLEDEIQAWESEAEWPVE